MEPLRRTSPTKHNGTTTMGMKKVEVIDLQKGFQMKGIKPVSYEFIGIKPTELNDVSHLTRQEFNERITELKEKLRYQSPKLQPEDTILHSMSTSTHWAPPSSRDCVDLSSEFQDITMNQQETNHTLDSEPFSDVAFPNKRPKMDLSSGFAAISSDQSIIDTGL